MARSKMLRKTCETCGQTSVAHTKNGQPHWEHTRVDRHMFAAFRKRHTPEAMQASVAPHAPPASDPSR